MPVYAWIIFAISIVSLAVAVTAWLDVSRQKRTLRNLFAEAGHERFGEVLLTHQTKLNRNQEHLKTLFGRVQDLEDLSKILVSRVGLVRYNPFENSGGNVSFSLALLNTKGNGVVMTSLHSRDGIRLYSKQVHEFGSDQMLTDEEKQAIEQAGSLYSEEPETDES